MSDPRTDEALFYQAVGLLVSSRRASTSWIQRNLCIGYNKASALMQRAQDEGVVSECNSVGKREVLIAAAPPKIVDTDNERVENSPMRHQYRVLSDDEKARMAAVKGKGDELLDLIAECGSGRELSIARTKTEEAVMWAVKHVTS